MITKLTVALKIGADTEPFSHSLGHQRKSAGLMDENRLPRACVTNLSAVASIRRPSSSLLASTSVGPQARVRSVHYASAGWSGHPKSSGRLALATNRSVRISCRRAHSCLVSRVGLPCSKLVI